MAKYHAIITEDHTKYNEDRNTISLEFDETDLEKVMTMAEMVLLHGDKAPSVFVWKEKE